MKFYTLAPLTKRAKQIINQHGDRWECVRTEEKVIFSDKCGPWMLLTPLDERRVAYTVIEAREDTASRWVHALMDEEFKVMP